MGISALRRRCASCGRGAQNLPEGRKLFETTCTPCHNYEKGGEPDMYGQTLNLYGVVGRKVASVAGVEDFRKYAKNGHRFGGGGHSYGHHLAAEGVFWDEE